MSSPLTLKSLDNTAPSEQFYLDLGNFISLSESEWKKVFEILRNSKEYPSIYDSAMTTFPNDPKKIQLENAASFVYYFLLRIFTKRITLEDLHDDFAKVISQKDTLIKIDQFFKSGLELEEHILAQEQNFASLTATMPRWNFVDIVIDERAVFDSNNEFLRRYPVLIMRLETQYRGDKKDITLQMTPSEAEYFTNVIKQYTDRSKKLRNKEGS